MAHTVQALDSLRLTCDEFYILVYNVRTLPLYVREASCGRNSAMLKEKPKCHYHVKRRVITAT